MFRASDRQPPNGALIYNIKPGDVVENSPLQRAIVDMAAAEWDTLAIQQLENTIKLESDALVKQRIERVNGAIEYMRNRSLENIVIVGDAAGANIALRCVNENSPESVVAVVGIGYWDEEIADDGIRILEIIGTTDGRATHAHKRRKAKTKTRKIPVESIQIDGADASFSGFEMLVAKRLKGWLARSTPGKVVKRRARTSRLDGG